MGHLEFCAVEKFATELKKDFPIIEHTHSYKDELQNIFNKHAKVIIDIALDNARDAFSAQAEKEAQINGH